MADHTESAALPPFEAEFARAWDIPGHTRYQLPDTDVNEVLATRYTTDGPLTLTRGMLCGLGRPGAVRQPAMTDDGQR